MSYPAFVEDEAYMEMDSSIPEIEQLRAMLGNLTRVHLLTANKFESLDALIKEYLLSGVEVFGLETGIVSEITEAGVYRIADLMSPLEVLHKGQEFPLEDTYCREVAKSKQVLGFPQVGKLDYMNCHPVYQNLKLESYLSAPIFVGERFYGTLNFTSIAPRMRGFSIHECNLITLMANSIGAFILSRQKEDKLVALNDRMKRLVGYVAHDLRSPLGGILSLAKLGTKETNLEKLKLYMASLIDPAERALEFVTTILENAALSTGKIALEKKNISVDELLRLALVSVAYFAQESQVTIQLPPTSDVMVKCDPKRLHQSLMNLFINAIKFAPSGGRITVKVCSEGGVCCISIVNEIDEDGEFSQLSEENVYGSVGFGLDIVREVMKAHGVRFSMEQQDSTYSVSFELPLSE